MKILGIETSCDETAAAVVEDGSRVLSNVVASQIDIHAETGGVVPEVAAREHVLQIIPVIEAALEAAAGAFNDQEPLRGNDQLPCSNCQTRTKNQGPSSKWDFIDAIAVTKGPGLVSSLLTGTTTASALAMSLGKPLIPVHHIEGHVMANWLGREAESFSFPILVLTVSGGHNELILMRGYGEYEVIGETLDDACGEAFDKVARLLGLGYPGGPVVSKRALLGDAGRFELPVVLMEKDSLDFSFSGLKTAVRYLVEEEKNIEFSPLRGLGKQNIDSGGEDGEIMLSEQTVNDIAAAFQDSVVKTFVEKVRRALEKYPEIREVHLTGGVSANSQLREGLLLFFGQRGGGIKFRYPENICFCTDNAAMIAGCAYFNFLKDPEAFKEWENCVADPHFIRF